MELPQAAEQEPEPEPIVKGNHVAEATTLTDSNPDIASEKIPAPSKSSYTPTTDGVDMDRINRLLSEFEKDK